MNIKSSNKIIDEIIEAVSYWRVLANEYRIPKETIREDRKKLSGVNLLTNYSAGTPQALRGHSTSTSRALHKWY